ncbi:heme oxygenase-like protein [Jaminaea rosea]|uniref:Heme oxygenase-like protein n=1 Tax=Jaminaea rosea TaxID=1569628 RepID=A0A316V5H3_9BASI|nr:heme oxygenase-like protein [Jaminaea rosea]PWN30665.1 heme oxygenase-like protein [Jaminaea rosea]
MPCPFARLAAFASPIDIAAAKVYHQQNNLYSDNGASSSKPVASSSASFPPLSEYLKHATAKAHREVESSQGVRQLMGFASSSSSSSDFTFSRLDYVRWMIMLACIYAALEASLTSAGNKAAEMAPALAPLYASRPASAPCRTLLNHLARFDATMADIEVHLRVLQSSEANEEGAGLSLSEIVDVLDDDDSEASAELRLSIAPVLSLLQSSPSSSKLQDDHLRLLHPAQALATAQYVRRLTDIAGIGGEPDLLLAHSYVRYLGDLSGGQHIKRRIEKLFPLPAAPSPSTGGFDFYDFPCPTSDEDLSAGAWHRELKDRFRDAMDASVSASAGMDRTKMMRAQGREARLAFELNKDLFESLVGNKPATILPELGSESEWSEEEADELLATIPPAIQQPISGGKSTTIPGIGAKQLLALSSMTAAPHTAVLPLVCSALVVAVLARGVVAVAAAATA